MTDLEYEQMLIDDAAAAAAELAQWNAKQAAEAAYWALIAEIDAAWKQATKHDYVGCITDECVDSENAESEVYGSYAYWKLMYASAVLAAGPRAEELGYNINKILGRSIY